MSKPDNATTLLRDLVRAKAAFQMRTVEAIITEGRDAPAAKEAARED